MTKTIYSNLLKNRRYVICLLLLFFLNPIKLHSKTVIDETGRKIIIPEYPKRIISLAPSITEIIYDLNQEHRLKGVTLFSDYPPQAKKLPVIGSYIHLDLEKIVSLRPDICIGIHDGNPKEVISRLEKLNIPVYLLNPKDFNAVTFSLNNLGKILNCEQRSKFLINDIKSRVNAISKKVEKINSKPGIFFQIGINPIVSAGNSTFIHELINMAGGKNLAKGQIPYPRFSIEQVIALSPDIIIIATMAREGGFDQVKAMWKKWKNINAVKNNMIFLVDSNLVNRPTYRLVEGLETLAKLIHPKLFN